MATTYHISQLDIKQTIGVGATSKVRLATVKGTSQHLVVKIIKKASIMKVNQVDHIYNEISIQRKLQHPFLVSMHGIDQDERFIYIFLEFVQGGEVYSYLLSVGKLRVHHASMYAAQVVIMFEYLHGLNVIYRDLKPENLLIGKDGYLKLADFGFAKEVLGRTYTFCGTPGYLAPEIILNKGHGKAADWWTLGVLLYELLVGIDPFYDEDPMTTYKKILSGRIRFPRLFDSYAKSLVKHLLVQDVSKRYGNLKGGVTDIKHHRFFGGIDWQRLISKHLPMPFTPRVKTQGDASLFKSYPNSESSTRAVSPSHDPFLGWGQ
mmetsp:Transcript_11783/g.22778  ORF Transcript_11783/g.22778 Transcript_11783/m.22778 type:complete len:320 (-) Transcript_11783:14-973(-)